MLRATVVIPHLNAPQALRRCLTSVVGQIAADCSFEVFVVDNGSVVPPTWGETFPGVRLLSEPAAGPGPARNAGAGQAYGEILVFIDADCEATDGWLQAIVSRMAADRTAILGGRIQILPAIGEAWTPPGVYESVFAYRQDRNVRSRAFAATANLAVPAKVFEAVGPFGGVDLPEDLEWCHRAREAGVRIDYAPEMLVSHLPRRTFADLRAKWRRHIYQDFCLAEARRAPVWRWWLGAAEVLAATPLRALRRLRGDLGLDASARLGALRVLIAIRAFRFAQMVAMGRRRPARPPWGLER